MALLVLCMESAYIPPLIGYLRTDFPNNLFGATCKSQQSFNGLPSQMATSAGGETYAVVPHYIVEYLHIGIHGLSVEA